MSTKTHTTARFGNLVVVAFDWAAQCSSDPRGIPILATKAVTYLLRHYRKTSPSRPAPVPLPFRDFPQLLAPEITDGRPGVSASTNG